eukprot:155714-Pyramimonas_sp.AAC.1
MREVGSTQRKGHPVEAYWNVLGASGSFLGPSWGSLGSLLEASWAPVGASRAPLGALLKSSWEPR